MEYKAGRKKVSEKVNKLQIHKTDFRSLNGNYRILFNSFDLYLYLVFYTENLGP